MHFTFQYIISERLKCPQEVDFSCSIKSTCSAVSLQKVKIWCKLSSLLLRLKKQNSQPEDRVATGTCLSLGTELFSGDAEIHWVRSWVGFQLQPTRMLLLIGERLNISGRILLPTFPHLCPVGTSCSRAGGRLNYSFPARGLHRAL